MEGVGGGEDGGCGEKEDGLEEEEAHFDGWGWIVGG